MSTVILSDSDEKRCAICYSEFDQVQKYTHVGGEKHPPFHRLCLETWVKDHNASCPIDREPIDPNSFPPLTLKERVIERLNVMLADKEFISSVEWGTLGLAALASFGAGQAILTGNYAFPISLGIGCAMHLSLRKELGSLRAAVATMASGALMMGLLINAELLLQAINPNEEAVANVTRMVEELGALGAATELAKALGTIIVIGGPTLAAAGIALGEGMLTLRRWFFG